MSDVDESEFHEGYEQAGNESSEEFAQAIVRWIYKVHADDRARKHAIDRAIAAMRREAKKL